MENIEPICEAVHKAYCKERIRQGKEPYWTGGDYSKLDEKTKDYDRATVRAVQEFMDNLEEQQAKRIIELEAGIIHIGNVLKAAIERPIEIAVDWKEFLLKFTEQALKV